MQYVALIGGESQSVHVVKYSDIIDAIDVYILSAYM